jgi:hypothetical protein
LVWRGVKIQGRYDNNNWVKSIQLEISDDGSDWNAILPAPNQKYGSYNYEFKANEDRNSIVHILFNERIRGKHLRIIPI